MIVEKSERRWAIESPAHELIVLERDTTRDEAKRLLRHEAGRRLVRITIGWQSQGKSGDPQPGHTRELR